MIKKAKGTRFKNLKGQDIHLTSLDSKHQLIIFKLVTTYIMYEYQSYILLELLFVPLEQ